jgi:Polyketide cyclase / dehydrase and lipid transport
VTVSRGEVTLSGPVLAYEMNDMISAVSSVRGVKRLENRLEGHQEAGQVSGLQGPSERLGERTELMQAHWSPASRFLVGAAGTFLTVYGLKRAGIPGSAMGLMGAAMLTRGLTNLEMKRLSGLGAGTRAVDLNRSITIKAPVERVFAFWKDYQNFPRFMSHVREVRQTGDNLNGGPENTCARRTAGVLLIS